MKFILSSKFGVFEEIREGRMHNGIDLAKPQGTELRAIGKGVIDKVFDGSGGIGKGVSIELDDGTHAIYGHMSDVDVSVDDKVDIGQLIGESGNTGHSSGAHLHFGLKGDNSDWLDPTPVADGLADLSGEAFDPFALFKLKGGMTEIFSSGIKDTIREKTEATVTEMIYGALDAFREVVLDSIYSISLIGTGVLILAVVVGYDPAKKYIGLLILANFLIKFLLGGYL